MKRRFALSALVVVCSFFLRSFSLARVWTDSSGTYRVEAELVKLEGDVVCLKKVDGTIAKVPLNRFCTDDQTFVRRQAAPAPQGTAPAVKATPVVAVQEGNAIMTKGAPDERTVPLRLIGFSLNIVLDKPCGPDRPA
jgi:hypothetical protein